MQLCLGVLAGESQRLRGIKSLVALPLLRQPLFLQKPIRLKTLVLFCRGGRGVGYPVAMATLLVQNGISTVVSRTDRGYCSYAPFSTTGREGSLPDERSRHVPHPAPPSNPHRFGGALGSDEATRHLGLIALVVCANLAAGFVLLVQQVII